jgi:hypothetical protein
MTPFQHSPGGLSIGMPERMPLVSHRPGDAAGGFPSSSIARDCAFPELRGSTTVYDEDLSNLDEWIRRLKIEYEIFFSGNRKKPPDDLRIRVERLVKRLAETTDMSFSQRFRYNTLISRFYVYRDLWRRNQQDQESAEREGKDQGRYGKSAPGKAKEKSPPPGIQISIGNPETEEEKVQRLYDELLRMKGETPGGTLPVPYKQFAKYISSQIQGIKEKHRCASVLFRIALEEKAVKFTATPDKGPSS